jgi:hypothetical protein
MSFKIGEVRGIQKEDNRGPLSIKSSLQKAMPFTLGNGGTFMIEYATENNMPIIF